MVDKHTQRECKDNPGVLDNLCLECYVASNGNRAVCGCEPKYPPYLSEFNHDGICVDCYRKGD